jgi:membrane associated rhomboid family serine protease
LSEWGGKNSVLILEDNEWWRLETPILLHAGVIHLLCNVVIQLETGVFFEKEWGSLRWLIIYLVSALGSSVLSVIAMPDAVSVGSSGAVMGLFGGKLAEITMRACERVRTKQDHVGKKVRKEQCIAVSCSVVLVMAFSFIPFVDWAAHVGGVLAGLCIGVIIFACEIESVPWRILWLVIGVALTTASFGYSMSYMYSGAIQPAEELRDVCAYYKEALGGDYECVCQREE